MAAPHPPQHPAARRTQRHKAGRALTVTSLGLLMLSASVADAAPPAKRSKSRSPLSGPVDGRAFMVGVEGAIIQASPLRTEVVRLDPRFVGRSVALGGLGLFARYRPKSIIGFDLGVRSGSLRYRGDDSDGAAVSQDQVMADAAVLLYLGRGQVAQFAVSSGLGGMYNRVGYSLDDGREGRHVFGSAVVRLGAEAEFLVKRVAFVLSFRSYAILTNRDHVKGSGELVENRDGAEVAPVPTFATQLLGSAGIAFRF